MWFDWEYYFYNIEITKIDDTYLQLLDFKEGRISSNDLLTSLLNKQLKYFAWAWQGIIDFKFLQKINLYFHNGVFAEDQLFGALLFLQSKYIYVIPHAFYIYRIRPNSLCDFNSKKIHLPRHFEEFCNIFDSREEVRCYHIASSWFFMLLELIRFVRDNPGDNDAKIKEFFFSYYAENSLKILDLKHDPLDIIPKMSQIESYLKKGFKYKHKLRIVNPKKYRRLKPFFDYIDYVYGLIKKIERNIRYVAKQYK